MTTKTTEITFADITAAAFAIIAVIPEVTKPTKREILLLSGASLPELRLLIDERIPSERGRRLVSRWLTDGIPQESLSEELNLSPRHTREIIDEAYHVLISQLVKKSP